MNEPQKPIALTVLSNGGGQDTTWLIERLAEDRDFYKRHIKGDLLIVGSDTGDEHDHTYRNVDRVAALCAKKGFKFFWITPDMGFHSPTWQSLTGQYKKNKSIGSAAFRQTCTDNLKVKVVDRFVEQYIKDHYGCKGSNKKAYHDFYERHGKIRLILGFAKGEETRTSNGNKFDPAWKKKVVERYYTLIEEGINRQDTIDYFKSKGLVVFPSNCRRCFYQSLQELEWMRRNDPVGASEWIEMEADKLAKYEMRPAKNYGVYGVKTLPEKFREAQEKYGHMTDKELNDYKMSHGHCIKSKY